MSQETVRNIEDQRDVHESIKPNTDSEVDRKDLSSESIAQNGGVLPPILATPRDMSLRLKQQCPGCGYLVEVGKQYDSTPGK
jgi:hypothetical protein